MPAFEIGWSCPARRALARMPEKVATAAVEFIYATLAASPHRVGKPLRLELEGLHGARRGDYRLIYRVDGQRQQVEIVAIEHRVLLRRIAQIEGKPEIGQVLDKHWAGTSGRRRARPGVGAVLVAEDRQR